MAWTKLWFSKHKGKTLPQVMFSDPDWFFWAFENGVFGEKGRLEAEAKDVYRKAQSIKIPQMRDRNWWQNMACIHQTGRFVIWR